MFISRGAAYKGMGSLRSAMRKVIGGTEKRMSQSWFFDAKSDVLSAPKVTSYVADGEEFVLIGTKAGKLYQLQADAQLDWVFDAKARFSTEEAMFLDEETLNSLNTIPLVTPLQRGGELHILVGCESGVLYCITQDGHLAWEVRTQGPIRGTPCLLQGDDGQITGILVGSHDGHIYTLSVAGKVMRKLPVLEPIETSPLVADELVIVGTQKGNVIALDKEGEVSWRFTTGDRITANIVACDLNRSGQQTLLVGSQDNNLYALSLDGEQEWSFMTEGAIISQVVCADINADGRQEIIFGSCDNNVYCIDASGELIWSYETDFWITDTPIVKDIDNDGIIEVVAGSYDHKIYVLDSQGSYKLDYIPGLSGIVDQSGHYSNTVNSEVGKNEGKFFCSFETKGNIVGCAVAQRSNIIITNTKQGKIYGVRVV